MLGGAVANALAFSGSSYMFSKLGKEDVDTARKRHDKAIEDLQTAQLAWSNKRAKQLDFFFFFNRNFKARVMPCKHSTMLIRLSH